MRVVVDTNIVVSALLTPAGTASHVVEVMTALDALPLLMDVPALAVHLPDTADLPFLEVAAAGGVGALITGNARHFVPVQGAHGIRVVSPREALELLAGAFPD